MTCRVSRVKSSYLLETARYLSSAKAVLADACGLSCEDESLALLRDAIGMREHVYRQAAGLDRKNRKRRLRVKKKA